MHGNATSFLDRIAYLQLKLSLPDDMLTKVDRMSMAHSLEVRVPFLDHEFVEYVATVPVEHRFRRWKTKWLLRKALEPHLPREILWGKKRGFSVPVGSWSIGRGRLNSPGATGRRTDVRDGSGWWGRMILDEWYRQEADVRRHSSVGSEAIPAV
jgi:asparagine synthase (glutamine-hydrolysing)